MILPDTTYLPGWPERLSDNAGAHYVRLRDGKPTNEFGGEVCLYGLVRDDGFVDRSTQWVPILGATAMDLTMSGGPWMTAHQLEEIGQTPIKVPPEPVEWPQ
jgi:hypothetical protein